MARRIIYEQTYKSGFSVVTGPSLLSNFYLESVAGSRKHLRSHNGNLEVLSNAYDKVIWSLRDAGRYGGGSPLAARMTETGPTAA